MMKKGLSVQGKENCISSGHSHEDEVRTYFEKIDISKEEFGMHLYDVMDMKGFTARDLSIKCGFNPNYIGCIERGQSFPSMEKFFIMCAALKVSPDRFFHDIYRMKKSATVLNETNNSGFTENVEFQEAVKNMSRLPENMFRFVSEFALMLADIAAETGLKTDAPVLYPGFGSMFGK